MILLDPGPDWWQDLNGLTGIITAVGVILAAWWAYKAKLHSEESKSDTAVVREQVANSHSTNLRDDLDALAKQVRDMAIDMAKVVTAVEATAELQRSTGHQVGEIRRDLDAKVRRHDQDVARIDADLDRLQNQGQRRTGWRS